MSPVVQRRIHHIAGMIAAIAIVAALVQAIRLWMAGLPLAAQPVSSKNLLLTALIAVLALAAWRLRPESGVPAALSRTSAAWSLALALTLVGLWFLAWSRTSGGEVEGLLLNDDAQVAAYLRSQDLEDQQAYPRIPTGVSLLSFEFTNSNDVHASGFVWQRYDHDLPADFQRGVILPEGTDAYRLTPAWDDDMGDYDSVGWYFDKTFRQRFDYRDYPFDRQSFWIRVWPLEAAVAPVLIPDFASYPPRPDIPVQGVDPLFVYGGWDPIDTAFSMQVNDYGVTYGAREPEPLTPDFYWNLMVKRDFLGPLMKHLPFMLVIASLLFTTLLMTSCDRERQSKFGLSTAGVAAASGGLVLTVIFEHSAIRGIIGSQQVSYIEVLPFCLYVMILLVTLNALLVAHGTAYPLLRWEDNLLPVVLYWPLLLMMLVTITAIALF
jgi:hypothetical protein